MNNLKDFKFKEAYFVKEIVVQDPDTGADVHMEVYKHQNGGLFAIDSSYLINEEDDDNLLINDPFVNHLNLDMMVELFPKSD